ncbi:hypothetical protein Mal4_03010 [Maioricimonas rarisocia]|uniref:Uncharacterized protein n=2 Tax=Maioricimonas rarisocia TaxID=2528026 RepID=A0A517Z0L1_9PLAN|nr:hypothetical protein Mal4_03010 [Maioricimonas rarisocia]
MILLALGLAAGCTNRDSPTPETPPDLEAEDSVAVKAKVFTFVETYEEDPSAARPLLEDLVEQLPGYDVGDYESTVADIANTGQTLMDDYENDALVSDLKALAEDLPGDVEEYLREQRLMGN